jgi:protoporphyrinogen oxidase
MANTYQNVAQRRESEMSSSIVVVGAGPAGLTAALCLARRGRPPLVLEADDTVGGISRTVERDGWRFDIGGHRFFTKVPEVDQFWRDVLPDGFLVRPRMSRIYYEGKFYDYPLKASNALRNLGVVRAVQCVGSYVAARVRPPKDQTTFEGWVTSRFGRRLYNTFFKTYTEKVWGVPGSKLRADWAAQRIKNLSLGRAVWSALRPRRNQTAITSLIEEFRYPRLGPGMMWEACRDQALGLGATIRLNAAVTAIEHEGGRARRVLDSSGSDFLCDSVISSMPIGELVLAMKPRPPRAVLDAAVGLQHRDFLTVALVVPEEAGFPDNWIYVHSPEVRIGRIQNFGRWSEFMVKPGRTCLGLEYFVNVGDDLWMMDDEQLVQFGTNELERIGLLGDHAVEQGFVTRVPKAYPVYDETYVDNVATLRAWLSDNVSNVHPVGRNGMHRYNNQDHSMLTAMLAVENIVDGAGHDLWQVNVEEDYHEEARGTSGTGRAAPVFAS